MLPALWQADRPGRGKIVFVGAVAVLFVGNRCSRWPARRCRMTIAAMVVFFTGFNLLEALLPSLDFQIRAARDQGHGDRRVLERAVLRHLRRRCRGGWLSQRHGAAAVFGFGLVLTALWLAHQREHVGAAGLQSKQLFDGRDVTWPR
jgi:hypothetical protein